MAGEQPTPQRAWRAACPNCGAPVEFRSAASSTAVCSFCRSTLARDGDALKRIGQSAELFDDHSPLQLGASGTLQGVTFTLIGRLQYGYADGTWNEWYLWFDNGRNGWLSEDNGAYVLAFDTPLTGPAPAASELQAGQRVSAGGVAWDVASVVQARLIAAQGELPRPPRTGAEFTVADLRNNLGEVGTLDYGDPAAVQFAMGRSAALSEFRMQGLKASSERTLGAAALNCPHCGAGLSVQLAGTKALSCGQCHSLIDLSQGVGEKLASVQQSASPPQGRLPKIALGSTGRLAIGSEGVLDWQCVGYLVRCDVPQDSGDEPGYWSEYLLFHRTAGFAFLVDTEDGWSLVRPLTGAPQVNGNLAQWEGGTYRKTFAYPAKVLWVEGEFYWLVKRDERALVTDFEGEGSASGRLLSREKTASEVTWSGGRQMPASAVEAAFGLKPEQLAREGSGDVRPSSGRSSMSLGTVVLLVVVLLVVMLLFTRCGGGDDCRTVEQAYGNLSPEYRQCVQSRGSGGGSRSGGGSWGGYSSGGGGHK